MEKGTCYIFGAGDYFSPAPSPVAGDYVIAADGGYNYLLQNGMEADMLIGDFDSLGQKPQHANIHTLPTEKDDTDMFAAISAGRELGYSMFRIYGGTGGRPDHTYANIQCIARLAAEGCRGFLYDDESLITVIKDSAISFPAGCSGMLSVFSYTDTCTGVFERGFKYDLENKTMQNTFPLGVSNEFTGEPCTLGVREGMLLVVYPKGISECG